MDSFINNLIKRMVEANIPYMKNIICIET